MTKLRTHYDNLKVARDAPDTVIRAAYRALTQKYHPDKNPDDARATQVMKLINQSYDVLSDPQLRREHDDWIAREETKQRQEQQRQQPSQQKPPPRQQQEQAIPEQWQSPQQSQQNEEISRSRLKKLLRRLFWDIPKAAVLSMFAYIIAVGSVFAVLGLIVWIAQIFGGEPTPPHGPKPYAAAAPAKMTDTPAADATAAVTDAAPAPAEAATSTTPPPTPKYVRPATAPNGIPWPINAGYVRGYPIDNDDGHSKVTIDNSQNDSAVFVKLVSLDGVTAYPVRQFFIPAGAQFTMNKVTRGRYDIRYRDLDTGGLSRSESFDADEHEVSDGIEYSTNIITLYKVENGNMQTYDLADDEF